MIENMVRIGAVALIVAGGIQAIASIFHLDNFKAESFQNRLWSPLQLAFAAFSWIAVIGFVGLFLAQPELAGYPGLIGFLMSALGAAIGGTASFVWGYVFPYVAKQQPGKSAMELAGRSGPIPGLAFVLVPYGALYWPGLFVLMASVIVADRLFIAAPILVMAGAALSLIGSFVRPLYALRNGGGIFLGVGLAWIGADIWPL
jgi:hypothetical protein